MMSKISLNTVKALMAGLVLGSASVGAAVLAPAQAMQDEEEQQTLSPKVAKALGEAYTLGEEQDQYGSAIVVIDNLLAQRSGSMTPFELATAYEIRGSFKVRSTPPDYQGALRDFESALRQNSFNEERTRQLRFNVAQLYFQEERYAEAAQYLQEYITFQQNAGQNINANTWYLLAAAHAGTENWRAARRPMENAIADMDEPKQNWYELLNAIYNQVGDESARGDLLVRMIGIWPNEESYWSQLAGAYSQAGRENDAAAVLELAYRAGLIDDPAKIIALIQYYSVLENPYRGGKLLEREMASGRIPETTQNLELLAQMWNLAREQKKAIEVLTRLADISDTGEVSYRLGQVYFADEQWSNAENTLRQALNKGGLTSAQTGDAWLLIGNAQYNIDTESDVQRQKALESWRRARNYSSSSRAANGWITYVESLIRIERDARRVELKRAEQRYKDDVKRCRSIIEIFERVGGSTTTSVEQLQSCERLVASEFDASTGIITYEDGETQDLTSG